MDAARFATIQDLFLSAVELPSEQRAAYLDEACRTAEGLVDPELREAVERCLAADASEDDFFLDHPLAEPTALVAEPPVAGRRLGPYRVLRLLGRGGMGAVYLAERDDLRRQVALKVVRGDLADPGARRRFLVERRLLARLEHPHIARLYDVGVADDGLPYFAMEYVEGEPLTTYCDRERLGLDARLRLFEQVGRTVQHAHQHFVVHRDLKPSNIYVTPGGEVKLLDFGIAKALDEAEQASEGASRTRTGHRLMTPAYAAPEQRAGEAITAAADVYSLGVVLYELLTGSRPEADVTAEPKRPSVAVTEATATATAVARGTTAERLARRLRGDLDRICQKALQPEPERRYASAEAFVEDVRRHLAGLPVTAQRDTPGYRLRAFVRRHRRGVVGGVGALVLLGLIVTLYTLRLAAERNAARLEAETAAAVTTFLLDLLAAAEPTTEPTDTLSVRTLLAEGTRTVGAMRGQPEVQARMMSVMGTVYARLGQYDRAAPLVERALAIRRSVLGPESPEVAESLNDLGELRREAGDLEGAESAHRDALRIRRAALGPEAPRVLESLNNLAVVLSLSGDFDEADALFREAIRGVERAREETPEMAEVYNNAAQLYQDQARYAEAEPMMRRALAIWRSTLGDAHGEVAIGLNNLGMLHSKMGDYAGAAALYRDAVARWRGLYGEDHPYVGFGLNNLGVVLDKQGRYAEAEAVKTTVVERHRRLLGDEHPEVAKALGNLAVTLSNQGELARAEALQREGLALARRSLGPDHPEVGNGLHNLATVLLRQGRPAEAARTYRRALALREAALGDDHPDTGRTRSFLGTALLRQGRADAAGPELRRGLAIQRAGLDDGNPVLIPSLNGVAEWLIEAGDLGEAERVLQDALGLGDSLDPDHADIVETRRLLRSLRDAERAPR